MNPFLSAMTRCLGFPRNGRASPALRPSYRRHKSRRPLLFLEPLEDRCLPSATVSIGDGSAIEGSNTLKYIDQFVANGSGGLSTARSSVFGPDETVCHQHGINVMAALRGAVSGSPWAPPLPAPT